MTRIRSIDWAFGRMGSLLCLCRSHHTAPLPTDCTANATAGGYDCVVGGQTVHVNATANVTQV